ncbi:hypothetical protein BGX23_005343 [Mortierella sp. AD031]|nr:hypothetical protein BGX23_005343 [Mortierella sp. AD031]
MEVSSGRKRTGKTYDYLGGAQKAGTDTKKAQLTEIRHRCNPPEAVKTTMESVHTLLGNQMDSWKAVQAKLNHASKACGPLVKWVIAQKLESSAQMIVLKASSIEKMIEELENSIATTRSTLVLISGVGSIKNEIKRVKSKVDRSVTLLESLSSEKGSLGGRKPTQEPAVPLLRGDHYITLALLLLFQIKVRGTPSQAAYGYLAEPQFQPPLVRFLPRSEEQWSR